MCIFLEQNSKKKDVETNLFIYFSFLADVHVTQKCLILRKIKREKKNPYKER